MTWTTETIAELTRLVSEGHTSNEVERLMGVSRNAIVSKASRLDLEWSTPAVGGRGQRTITPEKRQEIAALLKDGLSVKRIARRTKAGNDTVRMIRDGVDKIVRRTAPLPKLPPLQTQEPPMVVADVRQAAFRVVEGPPVRVASNVVTLPGTGVRTCQFIAGDGRPYTMCGERVAWLGCSWCSVHARRVWARHPLIADAAD